MQLRKPARIPATTRDALEMLPPETDGEKGIVATPPGWAIRASVEASTASGAASTSSLKPLCEDADAVAELGSGTGRLSERPQAALSAMAPKAPRVG
jgi:hypothetical protein